MTKPARKQQIEPGVWVYPPQPGYRAVMSSVSALLDWRHWVATGEARAVVTVRQYFDHLKYSQEERDRVMAHLALFGEGYRWFDEHGRPVPPDAQGTVKA